VAEALGVRPQSVHVAPTDTATCPWDVGTHASRGAFMACQSALLAAERARARIFELAEAHYPAEVEKNVRAARKKQPDFAPPCDVRAAARRDAFVLEDGVLRLRDQPDVPCLRVDLGRILRAAHFREQGEMLTVPAFYDPPNELPDWEKGVGNLSVAYAYGTQAVEVEVDTETGEVRLLRLVAAHDVGRALSPQALRGQIHGALAQGVGYALHEEVVTEGGRIVNPGFRDYKIPTACELDFPLEVVFVETDEAAGPFGAKGVGEPGLVPTAPAIANAVADAVGVRIHDLPITPAKVLAALAARGR
jgi:xanthine dehydrogenase molybdenum-binding subunit